MLNATMDVEKRTLKELLRGDESADAHADGNAEEQMLNWENDGVETRDTQKMEIEVDKRVTENALEMKMEVEMDIGVDEQRRECADRLRIRDEHGLEESDEVKMKMKMMDDEGNEKMDRLIKYLMYPPRYNEIGEEFMSEQEDSVIDVTLKVLEEVDCHGDEW